MCHSSQNTVRSSICYVCYNRQMNPTFGLEEEVFIVEPTKPSVQSLYYLSKLVWQQPKKYLRHTDSNFSRRKDILQGLMSGVEISTLVHSNTSALIEDLRQRRQELRAVAEGLIVAVGHLLDFEAPTNTCALQFHVGNLSNPEKTYANLIHFLPLLFLMAANSPMVSGRRYGQSWRLMNSYAVGPLREDWKYRFQDIIFAKRTETIELRSFDPIWDLERVKVLATLIEAIAGADINYDLDLARYNLLREKVAAGGFCPEVEGLYQELNAIVKVDKQWFTQTPSDIIYAHYEKHGLEDTYSALDYGYSHSELKIQEIKQSKKNIAKIVTGFAGYYIPKLPYDIWKYFKEN